MGRGTGKGTLTLLGKRIRAARLMADLSMFQTSMMMGFNNWSKLQRIERGRAEITASDLWRLSQITGRPLEWFYD